MRSARCYRDEHVKHVNTHKLLYLPQRIPYVVPVLISVFQSQWAALHQTVQLVVGALCVLALLVNRNDEYKGAVAHFVQEECGSVMRELNGLLADIDEERVSDKEARDRLGVLADDLDKATNKASIAKLTIGNAKIRRVQKEVVESLGGTHNG